MIPTIENILRGFRDGSYTMEQCVGWLAEHSKMDALWGSPPEANAHIVQVLPLKPQPETVTTATGPEGEITFVQSGDSRTVSVMDARLVRAAPDLLNALRPFALWADSMYTLADDAKVCGIYVRHFRDAAKIINSLDGGGSEPQSSEPR